MATGRVRSPAFVAYYMLVIVVALPCDFLHWGASVSEIQPSAAAIKCSGTVGLYCNLEMDCAVVSPTCKPHNISGMCSCRSREK